MQQQSHATPQAASSRAPSSIFSASSATGQGAMLYMGGPSLSGPYVPEDPCYPRVAMGQPSTPQASSGYNAVGQGVRLSHPAALDMSNLAYLATPQNQPVPGSGYLQSNASIPAPSPSPASRLLAEKARAALPSGPKKQCNCKNSRCLKLYCECFASGRYCEGCNCVNCFNNRENESVRQYHVELTLEKNPNAFRPKIQSSDMDTTAGHAKGCNCKKSACLKKYCECYQANIFCSDNCKCIDCKNFEGSEARRVAVGSGHGAHQAASSGGGPGGGAVSGAKRPRLSLSSSSAVATPSMAPGPAGAAPAGLLGLAAVTNSNATGSVLGGSNGGVRGVGGSVRVELHDRLVDGSLIWGICRLLLDLEYEVAEPAAAAPPPVTEVDAAQLRAGVHEKQERAVLKEFGEMLGRIMAMASQGADAAPSAAGGAGQHSAGDPAAAFATPQSDRMSRERDRPPLSPWTSTPLGLACTPPPRPHIYPNGTAGPPMAVVGGNLPSTPGPLLVYGGPPPGPHLATPLSTSHTATTFTAIPPHLQYMAMPADNPLLLQHSGAPPGQLHPPPHTVTPLQGGVTAAANGPGGGCPMVVLGAAPLQQESPSTHPPPHPLPHSAPLPPTTAPLAVAFPDTAPNVATAAGSVFAPPAADPATAPPTAACDAASPAAALPSIAAPPPAADTATQLLGSSDAQPAPVGGTSAAAAAVVPATSALQGREGQGMAGSGDAEGGSEPPTGPLTGGADTGS